MPKLKLFKSTSGFKDSYVATTSRAKALEAWGARTDLFAMGAAEQVDDPEILEQASKTPGPPLTVVRQPTAEMIAKACERLIAISAGATKADRSKFPTL